MISAMNLKREDVYITNVVKCRPPNNRDPEADEIKACNPFLFDQIKAIEPDLIILVRLVAAKRVLKDNTLKMKDIRGKICFHSDLPPTIAIYHPAALLRNENLKRPTWEDLQVAMAYIEEVINAEKD